MVSQARRRQLLDHGSLRHIDSLNRRIKTAIIRDINTHTLCCHRLYKIKENTRHVSVRINPTTPLQSIVSTTSLYSTFLSWLFMIEMSISGSTIILHARSSSHHQTGVLDHNQVMEPLDRHGDRRTNSGMFSDSAWRLVRCSLMTPSTTTPENLA